MKKHSIAPFAAGIIATVVVSAIATSVKASEIPGNDYSTSAKALEGANLQVQPEKNPQELHAQEALPSSPGNSDLPTTKYWYVGGDVGIGFPSSISPSLSDTETETISIGLDSGLVGSVKAGYQFDRTRLEGEVAIGSFNANEVNGTPIDELGDVTVSGKYVALMANGYYNIPTKSKLSPYVGGGIGIAFTSGSFETPEAAETVSSGTNFAYQVKAGVDYEVAPKGNAYLEYKYFNTTGSSSIGVNAIQVGYRQGF